jgi:hypothetical protein
MLTQQQTDYDTDLVQFKQESDAAIQLARESGMTIDLAEWLTVKRYAERYNLTTQVVTNWLARGIIPADCTMTLPELNDLRLVRNRPYR